MRYFTFLCTTAALMLSSCETQRTYFDAGGNEIDAPDDSPKNSSLEDRFTSSFTMKKNEQGVPMATSQKVSGFQAKINDARSGKHDTLDRKSFGGTSEFSEAQRASVWGAKQKEKKTFDRGAESPFSREMKPDFLKEGKGLIAHKDASFSSSRSDFEKIETSLQRTTQQRKESEYNTAQESSYFANQQAQAQAPKIISRDEYIRMTLEESRAMLGRDDDE